MKINPSLDLAIEKIHFFLSKEEEEEGKMEIFWSRSCLCFFPPLEIHRNTVEQLYLIYSQTHETWFHSKLNWWIVSSFSLFHNPIKYTSIRIHQLIITLMSSWIWCKRTFPICSFPLLSSFACLSSCETVGLSVRLPVDLIGVFVLKLFHLLVALLLLFIQMPDWPIQRVQPSRPLLQQHHHHNHLFISGTFFSSSWACFHCRPLSASISAHLPHWFSSFCLSICSAHDHLCVFVWSSMKMHCLSFLVLLSGPNSSLPGPTRKPPFVRKCRSFTHKLLWTKSHTAVSFISITFGDKENHFSLINGDYKIIKRAL